MMKIIFNLFSTAVDISKPDIKNPPSPTNEIIFFSGYTNEEEIAAGIEYPILPQVDPI